MILLVRLLALLIAATSIVAADLHPIVEGHTGYLLGASGDGKWIKADEVAKALPNETNFHVYGMTAALAEAKGGKAKSEEVPCDHPTASRRKMVSCEASSR
jgi:hypothetical protein